ncbi:pheromone/general odorant binding protein, partial [Escherichia coli]|uniref:pheromone/general odorant binding protein n=1 Tax=Escherichia coli TaxID=562 RepID=UPI00200BE50F
VNGGAELTPDPKLKCYIKCFMEIAGMYSEGEVDAEAVLAVLPDHMKQKLEPVVRACGTQRGADDCDTAYLTHVCWQRTNKADYFLV